jgi:hypothetical protein
MRWTSWLNRSAGRSCRQPSRPRPRRPVVLRLEELEGRLTPTGNITLTNGVLVNASGNALTAPPDKGEEIFVEAFWNTQGLPSNASYRVSYNVDGVTLYTANFNFGAGVSGTQSWAWYLGGWYAAPGTHNVTVTVDPDQSVAETTYGDNATSFSFTPVSAPDLPHKFITPLGGTPFQTWNFVNYVDVNPLSPAFNDYNGGSYAYDGHAGHDMTLGNFGTMDAGVPDLAAAAGTVIAVQDGNYDRNTVASNVPANYVILDHGNGWHTIYYHFRTNSILVHVGDTVVAGQVLGLAGSSGSSTLAHLHFEVQHNGDVVEEEYDKGTFWANPLPYQGTLSDVLGSSVTSSHVTATNDLNAEELPVAANVFSQAAGQEMTVWFQGNTRTNDAVAFKVYTPSGTEFPSLEFSFTASESHGGYWYYVTTLPANLAQGTWHVGVNINGTEITRDAFQVTGAGAGAAHLSQGSTYVRNGRTTPIDFGTVSQGGTAPQLTFTVSNLGSAALSLSNLVLPAGFSLVGSLPASLAVGASATFGIKMPTGTAASYAGIVQFTTSDPNAPTYAFDVKGTVSGGNTGALHGQVFNDLNADGIEEVADAGLMGWTVSLLNPADNSLLATTTTGFNGYYAFLNLAAGTYRVRETAPAGWSQSTANPADVSVGTADVLVSPFGVGMYAATHFAVSAPAAASAGTTFTFTVTALDQFNTPVLGYSATVHFTSSDGQAVLPVDSTLTNGTGTFSATLKTAGSQTITATDTVTTTATGTSNAIGVSPAAATHFGVSAPGSVSAGTPFTFTVRALDAFNNTATAYGGTVHFSSDDGAASLPADSPLTSGTGTFAALLRTAGTHTLAAVDSSTGSINGASGPITVFVATHFNVSASPASVIAGNSITLTVTALDANNNPATGYAGTVHFTSSDPQAGLPANTTLTNGVGSFGVTFRTAGNQTITATDTVTGSITGTSNAVSVSAAGLTRFVVGTPALAITGTAFSFTVTAADAFGNQVSGYVGTVHFTSSDTTASLPANSTLTNGTGSFNATLNRTGSQTLTATDTANGALTGSNSIAVRGLIVTAFTPAPTGFTVGFSKAFVNSSTSPINLYDAASAGYGAPDVTLVASDKTVVRGSLLINATNTGFTFVKTNVVPGGTSTGLLAAGTYTVTIVSGATAFKDAAGENLDGTNDGSNSASYTTTFTVAAPSGVVVTVPDLARGPDSADPINVPNNSTNGIPIALSNGAGVTDATFVLNYNANLLTITGGTVNPALTGAMFTVTTSGSGTGAQATIVFHSPTALASGAVRLGGLVATVPANSPYKSKELLHFSSLTLNGGAIAAAGDDGVHAVTFLGDASGDGVYTSADSVLISRVAAGADSGFAAYPVLDPAILGDLTGDGRITAADATALNLYLAGTTVTQVPTWPGVPSNLPSGPDPSLSIPTNLRVGPGGTVTVPVNIDDPHPAGSRGLTQAVLALRYDPSIFTVSAADIHLGTVPASGSGWTLQVIVDPATGQIAITLFSVTPISSSAGGSLVTIDFHVRPGARSGATPINLVPAVRISGRVMYTALDDDQGPLTLHPAPTAAANDPGMDGLVEVVSALLDRRHS